MYNTVGSMERTVFLSKCTNGVQIKCRVTLLYCTVSGSEYTKHVSKCTKRVPWFTADVLCTRLYGHYGAKRAMTELLIGRVFGQLFQYCTRVTRLHIM